MSRVWVEKNAYQKHVYVWVLTSKGETLAIDLTDGGVHASAFPVSVLTDPSTGLEEV